GNGVLGVHDFDFEGPNGGVAYVDGSFYVAVVLVREGGFAVVVESPQRAAFGHPLLDCFTLPGGHPGGEAGADFALDGRDADNLFRLFVPVDLVPVAVGVAAAIAE